jgi:hypothetical protein
MLISDIGEKGVRDPFILKSEIDGYYYILATDLRCASKKGWQWAQYEGSTALIFFKSKDLVTWSAPWRLEVAPDGAGCAWAPEAIYDKKANEYLVYFASMVKEEKDKEAKQRIYTVRTKDFIQFSTAEKFIERDNHVIDTTMIEENGVYYRFSKDETTKNIRVDKSTSLEKDSFEDVSMPIVESLQGVEGPLIFKFHNENKWCLMVDQYAAGLGYLPLISENLEKDFRVLDSENYHLGVAKKRHGSVLAISDEAYNRIKAKSPSK